MLGRRIGLLAVAAMASLASMGSMAGPLVLAPRPPMPTIFPSATVNSQCFGYPRKDRAKNAAQVKRASRKARNVAKHRRHA